jgi:hypothetical protein
MYSTVHYIRVPKVARQVVHWKAPNPKETKSKQNRRSRLAGSRQNLYNKNNQVLTDSLYLRSLDLGARPYVVFDEESDFSGPRT